MEKREGCSPFLFARLMDIITRHLYLVPEGCSQSSRDTVPPPDPCRKGGGSQAPKAGANQGDIGALPPPPLQAWQEVELPSLDRSPEALATSKLLYFTCESGVSPNALLCTCLALHPDRGRVPLPQKRPCREP